MHDSVDRSSHLKIVDVFSPGHPSQWKCLDPNVRFLMSHSAEVGGGVQGGPVSVLTRVFFSYE